MLNLKSFVRLSQQQSQILKFVNRHVSSADVKTVIANMEATKKNTDITKLDTTFENAETAFKSKTTFELVRGWLVFQLCSIGPLVNNQQSVRNYF